MELDEVRAEAAGCRACPLWKTGTQTVFGEGSDSAEVMFVGEQPGDQEDKQGRPFVGPAGRILDQAMADASIDRQKAYVTNVVKHFKWQALGKRRIHQKPNWSEIAACRPWLDGELDTVKPRLLLGLEERMVSHGILVLVALDRHVRLEGRVLALELEVILDYLCKEGGCLHRHSKSSRSVYERWSVAMLPVFLRDTGFERNEV